MTADRITAGFIPLIDAAPLIVAHELGFAEEAGIELVLVRESSWATIRDRIAVGHLDVAHLLAPIAIAGSLGLPPLPVSVIAPLALGTGRNAITVSPALAANLGRFGELNGNAVLTGQALKALAEERGTSAKVTIAVVHPFSAHAYFLNYWLRGCGIRPNEDVVVEVIPPSLMVDALKSGRIDACCVGEPWNTVAQNVGVGRAVVACDDIWSANPDKILGVRKAWAEDCPDLVHKTVRCVFQAAKWCDQLKNSDKLIGILPETALRYGNWNEEWVARYIEQDYHYVDAVVAKAKLTPRAFDWASVEEEGFLKGKSKRVMDEAGEFGIKTGYTVPIFQANGYLALASFDCDQEAPDQKIRAALQLATVYFHARLLAFRDAYLPCDDQLTPRQRECLHWVGEGKSDWEIGRLGRSSIFLKQQSTAMWRTQNASTK